MLSRQDNRVFTRDLKYLIKPRQTLVPRCRIGDHGWLIGGVVATTCCIALTTTLFISGSNASPEVSSNSGANFEIASSTATELLTTTTATPASSPVTVKPLPVLPVSAVAGVEIAPTATAPILAVTDDAEDHSNWHNHSIRRGDTLGKIFNRYDLPVVIANQLAKQESTSFVKRLSLGRKLGLLTDADNKLLKLSYEKNRFETLVIDVTHSPYQISLDKLETESRQQVAQGLITSSLFEAANQAELSDKIIMDVAGIFGWDLDFALDLRRGDRFTVIYEELYSKDKKIGDGDILAAEFTNQGVAHRAIRYTDDSGRVDYYSPEGASLRGTFLKSPMKFSRVTSGFSRKRFHPVLKKWRAHKGVDYGAPRGTPIYATADGRITLAGRKGGYGNAVALRHGGKYSTLYGHLSRIKSGVRPGKTIHQGDIVGYVGSTGLATGPHLHYEFRINGVHRNPLTWRSPKANSIDPGSLQKFSTLANHWVEQLALYAPTQVAQAQTGTSPL